MFFSKEPVEGKVSESERPTHGPAVVNATWRPCPRARSAVPRRGINERAVGAADAMQLHGSAAAPRGGRTLMENGHVHDTEEEMILAARLPVRSVPASPRVTPPSTLHPVHVCHPPRPCPSV